MANLRTAAAEIQNAKKVTGSTWEDSTYRQRIEETLQEITPDLVGERLTQAAKFFKPEWEVRSQKFLRRFMMWSKRRTSNVELRVYAKFGSSNGRNVPSQHLNVATLANNLDIGFPAALFQVVQLSALGLCHRVEPFVNLRGESVFNVVFPASSSYMRFYLGIRTAPTGEEFEDQEVIELADGVFAREIETNRPEKALNLIKNAVEAKREFEDRLPNGAVTRLCEKLLLRFKDAPGGALEAVDLSAKFGENVDVINFCLLVLALTDDNFVRTASVSTKGDLAFSYGPVAASKTAMPKTINIGDLSTQHAKEVLKAAAAQSPMQTDPVLPPGTVRLDAASLGAATVEQLQKTEQAVRERIEQVGASLHARVAQLESDPSNTGSVAELKLQVQIDVLRDQVAVLMKLAGVVKSEHRPNIRVHTDPTFLARAREPGAEKKKAKAKKAAKNITKKKANKKPTKKSKPRRK